MWTKDALAKDSGILYGSWDQSQPIFEIILDLTKAVSTVNHEIVVEKLINLI